MRYLKFGFWWAQMSQEKRLTEMEMGKPMFTSHNLSDPQTYLVPRGNLIRRINDPENNVLDQRSRSQVKVKCQ